jgi:hypothetical protein
MGTAETSREARGSIDTQRLRVQVLEAIRRAGRIGATCDEIEIGEGMPHQTCSARVSELASMGRIKDSYVRRKTRRGRKAVVWVLA